MKKITRAFACAAMTTLGLSLASAPVLAADVGVSVNVGQPGFYGRINIGNYPQPQVIYAQPVIIERVPVTVVRQPIYLRVPPGHEKHWSKHCRQYNACGQPVYFVQDSWYSNEYVPRYQHEHGDHHDERHDDHDDHHDHDDRHGDKDHGHGKGHKD